MMVKRQERAGHTTTAFRRWSRKSHAVFSSLHRVIKICTLSFVYTILALPVRAQVQSNNDSLQTRSYELPDIVVTAGRTPVEAQQAARLVTIITATETEGAAAQSLNDLLRLSGAVDVRQRGPLGAQADINIRGGTFDQTLILLNGINVTDPQTGHNNLNLPVNLESIERIEILRGPAAKSFGPNAFNGAVNIITGNSKPNHIRLSVMAGRHRLNKESLNISNTAGSFRHFLSISRIASDGYTHNTDLSNTSIFYQAGYDNKAGKTYFQSGLGMKDFGANSFYSLKYPDQFESTRTLFLNLKYESNTIIRVKPAVYLRRNLDRFELKRNDPSVPFNHHKTTVAGVNLNISAAHRYGETSIGFDLRNEHIISNVLGVTLTEPVAVRNFFGDYYTKYYNRLNASIYAEHTLILRKLSVNTGAMSLINTSDRLIRVYPGVDISYRLKNDFKIFASANKTLRLPTFTDMFYRSPVQQGNSELKPEEAMTIEGGIKYSRTPLRGDISFFRRWGYDLIDWVKDASPDSTVWRSMNHTSINFSGVEASLTFTPSGTDLAGRIRSFRLSWSFLKADREYNDMLSKYALDYLNHQATAAVDIRLFRSLFYSGQLTYHNRNGAYQDASGNMLQYKPFLLSDMKLYWKKELYTIYAEASNIFNSRYYDLGGIIQPGRWIRAGVIIDIDY